MTPRVAYFPDSFHEVNGVAHTSRNFVAYAERHHLPMLCIRAGAGPTHPAPQGTVQTLELPRSRAAVGVEKDLAFDPLFWRHAASIERALRRFQPDLLHLTGPSELGIFAAYFAWKLKLPLAASWHTNVHEYASRRLGWLTHRLGSGVGKSVERRVEAGALQSALRFYARAGILYAPNAELCGLLTRATGRPCRRMERGVDTQLFTPAQRTRPLVPTDVVGQGVEEAALRRSLPTAEFAGVLRGQALATAYAEMDMLVFPSHTDTFGNVVLEALASGVPAIVTPDGGPRFIVRVGTAKHAGTGVISHDGAFAGEIATLLRDSRRLCSMREAARAYALECSWDGVFAGVYAGYETLLDETQSSPVTSKAAIVAAPDRVLQRKAGM